MPNSSDVIAGDDALATQYNNLRKDVYNATSGHNHDGTDTGGRHLADKSVGTSKFVMYEGDEVAVDAGNSAGASAPSSEAKVKEVKLARGGKYRIKFTLRIVVTSGTVTASSGATVYRNGVAIGTPVTHNIVGASAGTYDSSVFSEDIDGWSALDLAQIYQGCSFSGGTGSSAVIDFQICSSGLEKSEVVL